MGKGEVAGRLCQFAERWLVRPPEFDRRRRPQTWILMRAIFPSPMRLTCRSNAADPAAEAAIGRGRSTTPTGSNKATVAMATSPKCNQISVGPYRSLWLHLDARGPARYMLVCGGRRP